ncbi:MAG: hypothetical protein HY958_06650 [Bacteroidia bacterium]|nr:hypothetical protein [Bacteroidia bacterium]
MNRCILLLCISYFFCSCSSDNNETKNNRSGNAKQNGIEKSQSAIKNLYDSSLVIGEINEKVKCKADTGISYTLYIPSKYSTENRRYPVIYFFDSHAKGMLPVSKYRELAEEFGYIIAGSNDSKNGLPVETTNAIGKTLITDISERLSVDNNRIYTSGFSGGARVAGAIALNGGVSGVIACSAGLPAAMPDKKFNFLGIAGTYDMNCLEMEKLDKSLEKSGWNHYLLLFDGRHEWPPLETMKDAFAWLALNAMKNKSAPVEDLFIEKFEKENLSEAANLAAKEKFYQARTVYNKLAVFLSGLKDISIFNNEIAAIDAKPEMKKIMEEKQKIESMETALQQAYLQAFQTKKPDWWKKETEKLQDKISKSGNTFEKAMFSRVLGFLSLVSFSYVNNSLRENNLNAAENYNKIYAIVDPPNPDHRYFAACIYAKKGDMKKALDELENAAGLGFDDIERLQGNEILRPLSGNKEFLKIIDKIRRKKEK